MQSTDSPVGGTWQQRARAGEVTAPGRGRAIDPAYLRCCAWDIGARRAHESWSSEANYVTVAGVTPVSGFVTWSVDPAWMEETARRRGEGFRDSRLILRVYDVSFIIWNGLNAHSMEDIGIDRLVGRTTFRVRHPGTTQIVEVGVRLRSGEFIPAARSLALALPADAVSRREEQCALYVDDRLCPEPVSSPWETESFLHQRNKPRLRRGLRVAVLSFESLPSGQETESAAFASRLATQLQAGGHEVHLLVPAAGELVEDRCIEGVHHHALPVERSADPLRDAFAFARACQARLESLPSFDLFHLNEWMTGLVPWAGTRPTVLSLTSIEATRRAGREPDQLSRDIARAEREVVSAVECVLVPHLLREELVAAYGADAAHVHAFPLDGCATREWDSPLDPTWVKRQVQLRPHERLLLFVGPVEQVAGADLLIEALPPVLAGVPDLRLAMVGVGSLLGSLDERARRLGVSHAVRWLGHVESRKLIRLLRVAEGLVLPARQRVAYDESLVGLARRAGRPVVLSHAGPAHLVRHEETGLLVYPHAGSVSWGLSRLLADPAHARRMGAAGWQPAADKTVDWSSVAEFYSEITAAIFGELAARVSDRPQRSEV